MVTEFLSYFQEERLALEVAQGQSNLTLPGTQVDPLSKQRFTNHLFTSEEEKFYRVRPRKVYLS